MVYSEEEYKKYKKKEVEKAKAQHYRKIILGSTRGIEKGIRGFAKQRRRQLQFAQQVSRPLYGRAGRPKGSYKGKYAAFGGVYGYRKALSQQRRLSSIQAQAQAGLTPEEQQALARFRLKQRASVVNPENRIIPDTTGYSFIGSYNQEIDDASNAVP